MGHLGYPAASWVKQVIWAKLMRRATADSKSCWQVALVLVVYLHLFRRNLLLKCAPQPKIAKNTKNPYFGVHGHSRSSMLAPLRSSSLVLVTISSKKSTCNRFHATQADSDKITTFLRGRAGTLIWRPRAQTSLNVRDWSRCLNC